MLQSSNTSDPERPLTRATLANQFVMEGEQVTALHQDLQIRSHFQPIYSLAHQRVVGYEALARPGAPDGTPLSPLSLFSGVNGLDEMVHVDRLCRALHVANFSRQENADSWLFLNLNPVVTLYGRRHGAFFAELLEHYRIAPHRIVIEILEGQIGDEDLLAEAVRYYRDMGCLIAIDDFGVGHSNFNRIWRIAPHIVKLDKTLIDQAITNRSVRRVLPGLVSLVHQAGGLALLEGIETEQQAMIALQADIDFVQGYYFARPAAPLLPDPYHHGIGKLFAALREDAAREELSSRELLAPYKDVFFNVVMDVLDGDSLERALAPFLEMPGVMRCYCLDEHGMQAGENLLPSGQPLNADPRFAAMQDTRQAIWARRHYFQRALAEPGLIQVSRPYLSLTGGSLCVTLSVALRMAQGVRVLCGDVAWEDR